VRIYILFLLDAGFRNNGLYQTHQLIRPLKLKVAEMIKFSHFCVMVERDIGRPLLI